MKIIEIKSLDNGGHRNQESDSFSVIPSGWAVIPNEMETENFPFGKVTVKEIDGIPTVTKWIAGVKPVIPEAELPVTEVEKLRADIDFLALMTGVEL